MTSEEQAKGEVQELGKELKCQGRLSEYKVYNR